MRRLDAGPRVGLTDRLLAFSIAWAVFRAIIVTAAQSYAEGYAAGIEDASPPVAKPEAPA